MLFPSHKMSGAPSPHIFTQRGIQSDGKLTAQHPTIERSTPHTISTVNSPHDIPQCNSELTTLEYDPMVTSPAPHCTLGQVVPPWTGGGSRLDLSLFFPYEMSGANTWTNLDYLDKEDSFDPIKMWDVRQTKKVSSFATSLPDNIIYFTLTAPGPNRPAAWFKDWRCLFIHTHTHTCCFSHTHTLCVYFHIHSTHTHIYCDHNVLVYACIVQAKDPVHRPVAGSGGRRHLHHCHRYIYLCYPVCFCVNSYITVTGDERAFAHVRRRVRVSSRRRVSKGAMRVWGIMTPEFVGVCK